MKKKLLIGLLSVAACFSLGSTSFADSGKAVTAAAASSAVSQVITAGNHYSTSITIKVGQSFQLTGSGFWITGQLPSGTIYLNSQGLVIGLKAGTAGVMADLPNGDTITYYFTVQ